MAQPSITSVTIDGSTFQALSAHVAFSTASDGSGLPVMGSLSAALEIVVDMHDDTNIPFDMIKKFFGLANVVTRDKIKDIKIEFWKDDNRRDALCSYAFKGWISHWSMGSGGRGVNHTLSISIQPTMDTKNFPDIRLSN